MNDLSRITHLAVSEIQNSRRLQWMMLAVLLILFFSLNKFVANSVTDLRVDTQRLINLAEQLQKIAEQPFDESQLTESMEQLNNALQPLPEAGSSSTAEAHAIKQVEKIIGPLLLRKRLNLLESQELKAHTNVFWQVRIEITGQLKQSDLIELLAHFDPSQTHRRINALRYRPNASNTLSVVADFLYRRTG